MHSLLLLALLLINDLIDAPKRFCAFKATYTIFGSGTAKCEAIRLDQLVAVGIRNGPGKVIDIAQERRYLAGQIIVVNTDGCDLVQADQVRMELSRSICWHLSTVVSV